MVLVERKAYCHVADAFLSRLELIWPISRLKSSGQNIQKNTLGEKFQESMG